jgi:serine/threonine protein kinase/WD40 repeat protein
MTNLHLIIEPPSGGRYEHRLVPGSYVLGRQEGSTDVVIPSPEVSRQHLRLTLTAIQCTVEDLGSTSGTTHQGQAVTGSVTLSYPLELHLGTVKVRVEAVTQSAEQGGAAGHYTKGKAIAQGGMGAVLEANDQLLGRTVAMKVVRHDIGDSESIRLRFIREATVLARLEHPSIVPIYEMGRDSEGRLFYTMKKVEGRTLQGILDDLKKGKPETVKEYTLDRLLNVFRKICDAMAFAHDRGVIHRDLKPENVMVGEYGEVLVMDWGLAKILQDAAQSAVELQLSNQAPGNASGTQMPTGFQELSDSQMSGSSQNLTMDGAVMGSPQYMPPEQAEGKVTEVDERSDIFSLGGILYAILTLKPPVEGRTVREVLDNVKNGRITPPTHYNTGSSTAHGEKLDKGSIKDPKLIIPLPHCPGGRVPSALSSVTMKAMAFEPANRYAEVEELARDVEAYQQGFATSAEQVSAMGQVLLFVKRHKGVSISAGVALVLIMFLSLGFMLKVNAEKNNALKARADAETEADNARKARAEAEAEADKATKAEAGTRAALARSAISLAEAALRERNGKLTQEALGEVPKDLRKDDWNYLLQQSDSSMGTVPDQGSSILAVLPHPTRPSVFFFANEKREVYLMNLRTGKVELRIPHALQGLKAYCLALSPDAQRIAIAGFNGSRKIAIYSVTDGRLLKDWDSPKSIQLLFSPDGKMLLQSAVDDVDKSAKFLKAWDAASGMLLWTTEKLTARTRMELSPEPGEFLSFGPHGPMRAHSFQDGSILRSMEKKGEAFASALDPGGRYLAMARADQRIGFYNLKTGEVDFSTVPREGEMQKLIPVQEGRRVVSVSQIKDGRQNIEVWDAVDGALRRSILGGIGRISDAAVHPLSGELVVTGTPTKWWDCLGERWRLSTGDLVPTFWGGEDLMLSQVGGQLALRRLGPSKVDMVWKPERLPIPFGSDAIANGKNAMIFNLDPETICLFLEKDGDQVNVLHRYILERHSWPGKSILSRDGRRFLMQIRYNLIGLAVRDTSDGKILAPLKYKDTKMLNDFAWSPDEQQVLGLITAKKPRGDAGSEEKLVVWSASTGEVVREKANDTAMDALAVSPNGTHFAEAGEDKRIRIRRLDTLDLVREFRAHEAQITALAWHPTRRILASTSTDLTIRLWDLDTGKRIAELHGCDLPPKRLFFSPGGTRIAAWDSKNVLVWESVSGTDDWATQGKVTSSTGRGP